jgi:hypothetical protein
MVRLCKSTEKHNDILTCSECYKLYCQLLPINLPSPIGITVAHCIDNILIAMNRPDERGVSLVCLRGAHATDDTPKKGVNHKFL